MKASSTNWPVRPSTSFEAAQSSRTMSVLVPSKRKLRASTKPLAQLTLSTRKLLAWLPFKSMLKRSASEPRKMTLFLFSLGTDTYSISSRLASVRLKLMGFTASSAFSAPRDFSKLGGLSVSCTDMIILLN